MVDGKIYVLGGYSAIQGEVLADVELYDPATDSWVKKSDMPFRLTMFGAAVVNGKIYVIGGTSDWGWAHGNQVWEYDPSFHTDIAAGSVSGLWTVDKSPYQINGDINIPNDSTLTIQPGVEVVFTGHYKFNVQGRLLAVGTKQDTIRFTAGNKEVGWHGIRFDNTPSSNDTSKLFYSSFTYGKANEGGNLDRSGGAIFINNFHKVVVSDCLFENNMNRGDNILDPGMYETGGAGIFIKNASPIIRRNTFMHNRGTSDGAIKCIYASSAIISGNVISHNTADWAAIVCEHGSNNRPTVSGNMISYNVAAKGGGGIGFFAASQARYENNVIVHNQGLYGGILCYNSGSPTFINNTIAFNTASIAGGGIACRGDSDPILMNNLLYANSAPLGKEVALDDDGCDPAFLFCDIQGGRADIWGSGAGAKYTGRYEHNIDGDPLFRNAALDDYRLSDDSPCIGAGVDSVEVTGAWCHVPLNCFGGNPRPNPAGSSPDIGAYENPLRIPTDVGRELTHPTIHLLYQNYPNPFNPSTTIKYELPRSSEVRLSVFDMLGREVTVLVDERREAGVHEIKFEGSALSSGVYFYRLLAGSFVETKRLILVK